MIDLIETQPVERQRRVRLTKPFTVSRFREKSPIKTICAASIQHQGGADDKRSTTALTNPLLRLLIHSSFAPMLQMGRRFGESIQ
jgi:hypothetical protein